MAIYHLSVKPIQRSKGRSATAAAAYRAGERVRDRRTGELFDYARRGGVEFKAILTPDGSQIGREDLWNMAEGAEKRKDGTTAREYEIALPAELDEEGRRALALKFAREIMARHHVAIDLTIHAPTPKGDQRNHHAHILATTREFSEGRLERKSAFDLSDRDRKKRGLDGRKQELERIRDLWEGMANRALERAERSERITAKSLADQGSRQEPTIHLGPRAAALERKGERTERGERNRQAMTSRRNLAELERLERQERGIRAARVRFIHEREERIRAKLERARREREKERERERKRAEEIAQRQRLEEERREIEARYGTDVRLMLDPEEPESVRQSPAYAEFMERLRIADGDELARLEAKIEDARRQREARGMFEDLAESTAADRADAARLKIIEMGMKEWESGDEARRLELEENARRVIEERARHAVEHMRARQLRGRE